MFPVLKGREAGVPFELPEKISQIIKTAVQADIHDGFICGLKENNGLFDPVFVDIGDRRLPQDLFKKAAEILLVHIGVFGQVPYIDLVLVMAPDKLQRRLDDPDPVIVGLFRLGQQRKGRKDAQDLQETCPDKKLGGHIFGDGFIFSGEKEACLMEDIQDVQIFLFHPGERRMGNVQETGELDGPFCQRLEQLGLGQIIVLKIQNTGMKYNGGFYSGGVSFYRMDLSRIYKEKAFPVNGKAFHINGHPKAALHKIEDLDLVVPVMLYAVPGSIVKNFI